MSRLRRIEQVDRFFFLTPNLASTCAPLSPLERTIILQELKSIRLSHNFLLFAFVLMPDHLHLLLYPRGVMLSDILRDFKCKSSFALREVRRKRGPIWQPRFFDSICRKVHVFWEKMDYIHQNPVRAGLVTRAEDWPWSSAATVHVGAILTADPIDLPADRDTLLWPAPWR
jgi:putative transposase